jgi:BASS family bile acid:Na+ symporter
MAANMRNLAAPLVAALAWLGGQGTRALAALVVIGIAIPPLGALFRPHVTEAVFVLLCISFMRVDAAALRAYLRRPLLVIAATLWSTFAVPLAFGLAGAAGGLDKAAPDLFLGLMLQAVASPMMASPALAALMGLDATLVLITLVTTTALVPFSAPLFASLFFDGALSLSPLALGLKLFAILGGSLLVAAVIRRVVGAAAIARHSRPIDGFNILILLVFVSAIMATVAESVLADPAGAMLLTLVAFAAFGALLGATVLAFRAAGRERALALGLMVSQRNLGLMLAGTDGALPGLVWFYFALSQFPIYLSPQLLKPVVERLRRAPPAA